jgi:hypothetical protein
VQAQAQAKKSEQEREYFLHCSRIWKLSKPNNLQVILGADATVSISKWGKKE